MAILRIRTNIEFKKGKNSTTGRISPLAVLRQDSTEPFRDIQEICKQPSSSPSGRASHLEVLSTKPLLSFSCALHEQYQKGRVSLVWHPSYWDQHEMLVNTDIFSYKLLSRHKGGLGEWTFLIQGLFSNLTT
jgi:hypothetical protein